MAWSSSKVSRAFLADVFTDTAAFDLVSDTVRAALYNNNITPDQDAASAAYAYNAGQWDNTNEVYEAGQWDAKGVALTNKVINSGTSATVFFDADDTASGSAADLANVYGCLVYSDTVSSPVADQGICHNYFGGSNSVVNGTFTIIWSANGIFRFTL